MSFRKTAVAIALGLLVVAPISSAKNRLTADMAEELEGAASASVGEALGELMTVLSNSSISKRERMRAVRAIVRQRLDYPSFSRFALGQSKKHFSQAQLDHYNCEFNAYLSNYIGTRFARYHREQSHVFRATALPNRDVVLSVLISGGKLDQATVTFLMREIDPHTGEWRAIDISFEKAAARKLLRKEFKSALEAGGPDQLIEMLQEQTPGPSHCATSDASTDREQHETIDEALEPESAPIRR
jgi:ABC-type transporter MlaC component